MSKHGDNLKLPLCPLCGDTKFVQNQGTILLVVTTGGWFYCTKCKIGWNRDFGIEEYKRFM